ncbi:MAG: winged helix-turn-helix domain-containing protein [Thaumarchaeota archaeon]|nr:winged helix-turn-helix domain-containing protein [Nitrososphaerota archaeon]
MERPDLYVLARFLDTLHGNGQPMKKTNLQMRVGLNYPRFMKYLEWMVSHGFVQQKKDEDGAELYSLSPQGLDAYHRLVAWIRETMKGMRI